MDDIGNLLNGFANLWSIDALLWCVIGVLVGTLIGALPGLVLGGWASVATAVVCCTLLGAVHNLTGRSLRWTAPAAVAVLLFV